MANFGQESKPIPLIARMSQETLAEMIGTTRSRVSFFLNRFREMGFIEVNSGGIHVHSSLVSFVLHDQLQAALLGTSRSTLRLATPAP
jgi:CRP/FNR family cyclic AMP-dependent transcriptional regulator